MAIRLRPPKSTVATWSVFTQFFQKNVVDPFRNYLHNRHRAAAEALPGIMADVAKELKPALDAAEHAITTTGKLLRASLEPTFGAMAKAQFEAASSLFTKAGLSTPETAIDEASKAFAQAYAFGMSSGAVTALFEMLVPEKLNVLNGTGAMLAEMAGFKEVTGQVLDPLYKNAFGVALEYHFKSQFKPEFASERDAVKWFSQRVMTERHLREVFEFSGLKKQYEQSYVDGAYRAIQPRALATLIQDTPFPAAQMQRVLEFGQYRDEDIAFLLPVLEANSTKNVRQQYLSALERSVEMGVETPAELSKRMTEMHYSQDAQNWVQLTVGTRKLEQLAQLYRKSVSESYKYGTITDAQYVPALEAIGINAADAQAHYAIDSIAKQGKILAAALKAEERLAEQQKSAAMRAAIAEYRAGTIDSAALEAALLAAGIDPAITSFAVVVQTARTEGTLVMVFGVELGHAAALLLKEKVAAYKEQAIKKLGTPAIWLAELEALGIPAANARALVSEWEAHANKVAIPV